METNHLNALWGYLVAHTLSALGLKQGVFSPGSRSTPLVWGFHSCVELEKVVILDERSAAFFALGLAQQKGQPVALVCTSGTAAAEYLPAVIEAAHSHIPLIVLTADRPPEAQFCSQRQTMDQSGLYGRFPVFQLNFPLPCEEAGVMAGVVGQVMEVWERAQSPKPGPVHLNFPFREPFLPIDAGWVQDHAQPFLKGLKPSLPWTLHLRPPVSLQADLQSWFGKSGLIIVGPHNPPEGSQWAQTIGRLAQQLGWPILAEGLSPLRPEDSPWCISQYDAILGAVGSRAGLRPEIALCIGPLPVSKHLRQFLADFPSETYLLSPYFNNTDPLHRKAIRLPGTPASLLDLLTSGAPALPTPHRLSQIWLKAEAVARDYQDRFLDGVPWPFEGKVAAILTQYLPKGTPLWVANSMPVRDISSFGGVGGPDLRVYFNRGVDGIDGTLSSALGMAHGNAPGVLLTGDLSLLHDSSGWLAGSQLRGHLTIVLINNRGGGIFRTLPIAHTDPQFLETYFLTPQQVDFALLAHAYGASYERPASWERFVELIRVLPKRGIRLIEIQTDSAPDHTFRSAYLKGLRTLLTEVIFQEPK